MASLRFPMQKLLTKNKHKSSKTTWLCCLRRRLLIAAKRKKKILLNTLKSWQKNGKKRKPKDTEYPKYPPYAPMPMPTYPGFDPHKIICSDGTGSPPPELGTTVSDAHPCQEIDLGKQFVGVDMKFDAEVHKTKTYC